MSRVRQHHLEKAKTGRMSTLIAARSARAQKSTLLPLRGGELRAVRNAHRSIVNSIKPYERRREKNCRPSAIWPSDVPQQRAVTVMSGRRSAARGARAPRHELMAALQNFRHRRTS